MQDAVAGTAMLTDGFEDEIDSVTPRSPVAGMGVGATPGGVGLGGIGVGGKKVRLYGEPGGPPAERLDFKLVESFILDQEDLDNPIMKTASELLLSSATDGVDLRTVDPETQARLEALLEAAGIGKLSTADGKAFADPEVLRRLTSSVSCALDEAAAALTRMRAENTLNAGQADNRSLAEACSDGDVNAVRKLLDEGRSVNEHTEEGESLLCLACSAGYYELAQVLLAMHANVEDRGIKGDITPLMAAASGGYVDIVKLLLVHGADVNAQSSTGNTALTYACAGGFVDVVKVLLKEGANIEDHNENGHTPLMEAASAGHVEVARVLLEYGAGINTHSNEFKESALTLACYKGHLDMVRFLLEAGADQEHKTDEMHTALMEACMDGHVEVARLLLDSGAQVNMPADSFESPLTLAACGGHVELAALLIERGANLEEVNDEGYTPLMEAAREGHEEMVALLLAQGANINAQTEETQETALTLACCGGFLEVADFLIKAGADIELGCSTPLMEAAQEGHLELVKYLLAAGANVHATTATGDTALTYACENGHTDVADVLLQAGANLEHESEGGRTPLMKAARAGHLCTVQFLISKGANVNRATANNDHTVVSLACAGGHLAVVELLLAHGADPTHRLKDGSTMLIEAAKGGHTNVVSYLLDYPNILSVPAPDLSQLTPPSQDASQVNRAIMLFLVSHSKLSLWWFPLKSQTEHHQTSQHPHLSQTKTSANISSPPSVLPLYPSVDIDAHTESNHDTALTLACAGGHEELVSVLIARGANIEHRDKKGFTPLILAATAGHVGVVEVLLDKGGDIEAQSERTKDTPLSLACSGGRQEVVELLLLRGANKEHRNVSDYTPLSLAASGGYVNIIKILLNAGAEINSRTGSKLGISPLMLAAMNGHVPAVKLLLDMGSDINAQIETNRNTALTLACFQGRAEVVSLLLDRKANVEHRAKTGLTPLMEAASGGYAEVGRVLLDKGADVNAPPVPSSRDTALTIAADKGHYKFCELLINRGAHIDVRNKKGNTPLWLAANGGHFDVVQLLVHASADVDAADNRKITPLMAAYRKGHVKVVQYLVKEVNQFPSDIECMRYIATIADKELLKKCHQCMETIVKAKDQQAAEANKNASILLKELDLEKSREESKKQALAAKREKRKEKRKKKKEEQKRKQEEEEGQKIKEDSLDIQELKEDSAEESEVPIEPPSATTTTTIGISATSATFTTAFGKKRASVATTPSTNRKNKKNKTKDSPNEPIILQDQQPRGGGGGVTGGNSDSDPLDSTDCASESSSSGGKSQELNYLPDLTSSTSSSSSSSSSSSAPSSGVAQTQAVLVDMHDSTSNPLPSPFKTMALPVTSPNSKLSLTSPKRGQKREEGWKEVVRRSKKLSVPASVVSRIMGRGGCNITAIQDVTGAHIDVDKQKDKNGERMITIRGGTESTRYAVQLINALIQDPAKELEDLIPRNHIRVPGSKSSSSSFGNSTGGGGGSNSGPKSLSSLVTSTGVSFQPSSSSSSSSSQAGGKMGKGLSSNVRQPFPVSLPLAYAHPQLALLAAQTMHQIRHPRLPMAQFGGTFPPAASTWGPFPVRPVSPGSANSSPKHNGGSAAGPARPNSTPSEHSNTSTAVATSTTTTSSPSSSAASATPLIPNPTPYNPQPSIATPSSVRKQLFAPDPKSAAVTSVSVAASATSSGNAVRGTGSPAHHSSSTTPLNASQQQVGSMSQPPLQQVKMEPSAVLTAGKEKPPQHTENQPVSASDGIASAGFTAANVALAPKPEPRQQLPAPSSSISSTEPLPALLNSQPNSHLTVVPPPVLSHNVAHPNNTLPHFSAPAPRVSHRMQPPGPYYSLPEQQQMQTQQQSQSVFVPFNPQQEPAKQTQNQTSQSTSLPLHAQSQAQSSLQVSANLGMINGSQIQHVANAGKQMPPNFGPAGLFNFSSIFDNNNQVRQINCFCTRVINHFEVLVAIFLTNTKAMALFAQLCVRNVISEVETIHAGTYPLSICQYCISLPLPPPSGESPVPPPSTASSSSLSTSAVVPPPQPKQGASSQQDRKVPPPIGTERLARIRQTGSVNPPLLTTSYTASVGQGGIWSFEGMSGWSQPLMSSHMMHPQLQAEQSTFSQHQPMEQDDTGIANPANNFHQPQHMPNTYMDFPKGIPMSMYGGTMLPTHPPMADGPGGPMYNGLHAGDPAWSPIIKVVPNNADNTDPQQQMWPGTWAPHVGNVHLNHVN
uniref:Ankyrin repeat and KH domain containing 1 n=1 Tax=Hippocampus comes TaxID=109280 RepID=A0A3Q2XHJ6_HIPCM